MADKSPLDSPGPGSQWSLVSPPLSLTQHHYTLNVSTQQGAAQVYTHRPVCKILCQVNFNLIEGRGILIQTYLLCSY